MRCTAVLLALAATSCSPALNAARPGGDGIALATTYTQASFDYLVACAAP